MLSYFLSIMKQNCGSFVCVQLLQTLNILFENIRHKTSLCKFSFYGFSHIIVYASEKRIIGMSCLTVRLAISLSAFLFSSAYRNDLNKILRDRSLGLGTPSCILSSKSIPS